jgi:hypothetical protein
MNQRLFNTILVLELTVIAFIALGMAILLSRLA